MEKSGNDLRINIGSIQTKRELGIESILASNPENDHQPLSPLSRLFHQPTSNLYIIFVVGVKGSINPDAVKAQAVNTLIRHPRFSSVVQVVDKEKGNEMKWVRTQVDIDKHIIVPNIDPSMDSPDKFVEDYASNLCKTTIDMSIPLWELHLLNVKTSHADAVEIFKMHHSLGDGVSLMSFFLSFWPKVSNPEAFLTLPTMKKSSSNNSKGLRENFWLFWNTHIDNLMLLATTLFLKDTQTPMSTAAGIGPTPWRFVHRIVSIDDIKLVKNAMNATINDVVMGVTQAALSKYMNRIYGNTKKGEENSKKKNDYIPKNFRQRAMLIVNLRESEGTKVKWGNIFSHVLLPLNIALRDDPLDYVRNAKATIDRKKNSNEALSTFHLINSIIKNFGSKVGGYVFKRASSHATLFFSNVMGPSEEIAIFGNEITYLIPGVCGIPNAMMIHFQNYGNKMIFGLTVDERAIPDPHQLCDDIEESLKLIKNNVIAGGFLASSRM